jgi:uncharacterized protein YndB with AHSA1/START domain
MSTNTAAPVTSAAASAAATAAPNEIGITRLYDAPLDMVWDAWTDLQQIAQWWGPRGFTITTHSKELRPGGRWVYTMHGPDGTDYPNIAYYHEVVPKQLLVYDHGATETTPPLFHVTVRFTEVNGKTQLDMTMALPTPEAAEETRRFIKKAGGNSTWDRLAEYLESETSQHDIFVIARSFATPIDTMFDVWTTPDHLAKWLPPTGFTMRFLRVDLKAGGDGFYLMTNDAGVTMYGRVSYRELHRPDRVVYTQQFCDEQERVTRHPMVPTWPETMLTTVTFVEEGPNQTRVQVRWEVYGDATPEERETFRNFRDSMTQGWTGSFDKLDEYLSR